MQIPIHTKPITQIDLKCLCHAHNFMKATHINQFAEIHDIHSNSLYTVHKFAGEVNMLMQNNSI